MKRQKNSAALYRSGGYTQCVQNSISTLTESFTFQREVFLLIPNQLATLKKHYSEILEEMRKKGFTPASVKCTSRIGERDQSYMVSKFLLF